MLWCAHRWALCRVGVDSRVANVKLWLISQSPASSVWKKFLVPSTKVQGVKCVESDHWKAKSLPKSRWDLDRASKKMIQKCGSSEYFTKNVSDAGPVLVLCMKLIHLSLLWNWRCLPDVCGLFGCLAIANDDWAITSDFVQLPWRQRVKLFAIISPSFVDRATRSQVILAEKYCLWVLPSHTLNRRFGSLFSIQSVS